MGELERYGLLSLASILVLFLVLTFVGRDPEFPEPVVRAAARDGDPLILSEPARAVRPATRSRAGSVRRTGQRSRKVLSHVVRRGETLSGIARKYLGSSRLWPELVAVNAPLDPRKLPIGKVLRIPGPRKVRTAAAATPAKTPEPAIAGRPESTGRSLLMLGPRRHVVRKGDTLSSISNRYYGDYMQWKRIYSANRKRIPDARKLEVGTILVLP